MDKKEVKEVKAELDKKFEKEVFEKNEEELKDKAGLEAAPAIKTDEQLANLIEAAKKQNALINQEIHREGVFRTGQLQVIQTTGDDTRKPYVLSPKQQDQVKYILANSGADSASQIKAYDQLKALLEEVV
jgi:hypothetical protein